jgi:hypothetical protein
MNLGVSTHGALLHARGAEVLLGVLHVNPFGPFLAVSGNP